MSRLTELCQWLLNKLETHDLKKQCECTLKYEIWWWNWGKMIKVIYTGVCVGPAHIRKTVDKNVPKSTGMSRISSYESACVRVCLITSSIPIVDPRVSHLFYAIYHIYYSYISDIQYFFIYYIYIYISNQYEWSVGLWSQNHITSFCNAAFKEYLHSYISYGENLIFQSGWVWGWLCEDFSSIVRISHVFLIRYYIVYSRYAILSWCD